MNRILKMSLITLLWFVANMAMCNSSNATIYFYFDAEDGVIGEELPHHQSSGPEFCQSECSGSGTRATYQPTGGAPQGNQYFQWDIVANQHEHYTEIKNKGVFPLTDILGDTLYMAFYMRFDRQRGNDLWSEGSGTQSHDKLAEMRGYGVRWTIGVGQWDECRGSYNPGMMANQDHHFSIYGGNPSYHLNGDVEPFTANLAGYSCSNTPQLEYERWYSVVLGIKMASNATGSRTMWLNGVKIAEDLNIQTTIDSSPTITHMDMGGTLQQPAYSIPGHTRKFDALMLTDDWQDIIDGGYLSVSGEDTTAPTTSGHNPSKSATGIAPNINIVVHVLDSGDGVDQSSIAMTVEGSPVSPTITGTAANYTLTYDPHTDFSPGQVVDVTIDAKDSHSPANVMATDTYSFTITPPSGTPLSGTYTKEFGSAIGTDYPGTMEDTFININEGKAFASEYLNTYTYPQDTVANVIIMKWDLSAIPSSARIQSAILHLYLSNMEDGGGDDLYDLTVHKIIHYNPVISACTGYTYNGTNSWTPNSQCYNNIPLAQADIATAEDTKSINKTYGYKSWSVTSLVQDWVSNQGSNYGMLVNSDTVASSNSNRFFNATESSNPDQRPKLVVTYTVGDDLSPPQKLIRIAP